MGATRAMDRQLTSNGLPTFQLPFHTAPELGYGGTAPAAKLGLQLLVRCEALLQGGVLMARNRAWPVNAKPLSNFGLPWTVRAAQVPWGGEGGGKVVESQPRPAPEPATPTA